MLQLECCGWEGVKEFAGTSQPIDDSCYERVTPTVSGIVARYSTVQYSCQPTLLIFGEGNWDIRDFSFIDALRLDPV